MQDPSPDEEPDFRSLVDYLDGIAVWVVSTPGEFDYVSDGAEDIWGVPVAVIEDDPERMLSGIHPEDREWVRSLVEQPPESVSEESYENRVVQPDDTVRWVHTRQIPVRDDDGDLLNVVGVTTDITDVKRREEEFEALSRILRHDVRNDMSVILGWGERLEAHVDDEGRDSFEKIMAAADHIVELTDIARDYAETITSGETMAVKPVALRPLLEQELATRREFFPDATIELDGDVPDVEVVANEMLSSVVRNLVNNAVQHNDAEDPAVQVSVDLVDDAAVVSIADNGPGVPPEIRDSVFERERKGIDSSGAGIGLSLVQTLVEQFDGDVWVTDNTPTGSVFHVRLPRAD